MAGTYDAIIIGGGHNGLVTACYLARAKWKVLVLERRYLVGGACGCARRQHGQRECGGSKMDRGSQLH